MSRITFATAALPAALCFVVLTGQETSTLLARVHALGLESLPGSVVAYVWLEDTRAREPVPIKVPKRGLQLVAR